MDESIVARFWSRVEPGHPDSCWIFQKAKGGPCTEHTAIFSGDKETRTKIFAHRLSYIIHKGEIPDGLYVRHTCDNPPCVNPHHLVLGTHLDNIRDMIERGRGVRGESVGSAMLTEEQVHAIRVRHAAGGITLAQLAAIYGVGAITIHCIVQRKTWRHI